MAFLAILISITGCSPMYMAEQLRIAAKKIEENANKSNKVDPGNVGLRKKVDESAEKDRRGITLVNKERQRFALVIGNANYKHARPPCRNGRMRPG